MKNPVGWFEIPVTDLERAQKFYESLFDIKLTPNKMGEYEMLFFPGSPETYGTPGSLIKGDGYHPAKDGVIIYFTAPDIDATIAKAQELGAKIILPKKDIDPYGTIAWIKDCEGNTIAFHRAKKMS